MVIFIGMGFGWIAGLASGDAQAQKLADAGKCDGSHYVTTYVPRFIKDGSGIERVKFVVPCNRWVEGKFPVFSYPNEDKLVLKVGAQVMFIKNDSSPEKRYFNGKIGKVIHLDTDEVVVKCPDDDFTIITKPETWENITYKVDKETDAITEDKIGSYTQMPLRLAWSITIHKSQGLTFEKAVIDAEGAFAHGQTYVALSRCKSLEGLVLKSKIDSRQIISDTNVINFTKQVEENQPDEKELEQSKSIFQLQLISEVFDFFQFIYPVNRILDIYYKNRGSIEGNLEQPKQPPILLHLKQSKMKTLVHPYELNQLAKR